MTLLKRLGINDVGSPTQVGGNDWDELYDYLNGIALAGKSASIETATQIGTGKATIAGYIDLIKVAAPGNPPSGSVRLFPASSDDKLYIKKSDGSTIDLESGGAGGAGDVTGSANVGTGTGTIFRDEVAGVLNLKTILAGAGISITNNANDVTLTATTAVLPIATYNYYVYKDPADSLYKARNGNTGTVLGTTSATNLAAVLDAVIADISPAGTPTKIEIQAGNFDLTAAMAAFDSTKIGNLNIVGQGPGVTNLILKTSITGNPNIFDFSGALTGSQANLTVNGAAQALTLTIADTTSFAVNDFILVRSTKAFVTAGQGKQGEIRQIRSKTGTVLTLDGPIQDTYNTADTANIIKINMIQNITLQNLTIKPENTSYNQTGSFISARYGKFVNIRNVQVYNMPGSNTQCVYFRSCVESKMDNVTGIMEESFPVTGSHPYCLKFAQACRNCTMDSCNVVGGWRHVVASEGSDAADSEGACRGITINNCYCVGIRDSGFDTHENGEDIQFTNCTVEGGEEHGFNIRSPGVQVKNCNVVGVDDYGIYTFQDANDVLLIGNSIRRCGSGIRLADDTQRVVISSNKIQDCANHGIYLSNNITDVEIIGNELNNNTISANNAAIYDASIAGSPTNRITLIGNRIMNHHRAIRMNADSTGWKIAFNNFENNTNSSQLVGTNKIWGNTGDGGIVDNMTAGSGATTLDELTDVAITAVARGDLLVRNTTEFANKAKGTAGQVLTMDVTGNDPVWATPAGGGGIQDYDFIVYIDPSNGSYKARNGRTGIVDYSSGTGPSDADVGFILSSIFANYSAGVPLAVLIGPGTFIVKTWDVDDFRRSNFTIKGCGSDVTIFTIHDDLQIVNGTNRAFAFEAQPTTFTQISLAANAPKDSFAVMTNANTDLVAGCHVQLGSNAVLPLDVCKTGQHNRVVKIIATGGSPSHRIILEKYTWYDYNTADVAWIRRVDYLENITIEGFTVQAQAATTENINIMRFDFAYNLHMRDVHFKDWAEINTGTFHSGLVHNNVVNSVCSDLVFEQSPERGTGMTENWVGYAISCRAGCETLYYVDVRCMGGIRHCFTTTANGETAKSGQPRNIWLINCNSETATEASWDTHGAGDGINFVNCSVHSTRTPGDTDTTAGPDDADAFNIRCINVSFTNCSVQNCRGTGFSFDGNTFGHRVNNCRAKDIKLGRNALQFGASNVQVNGFTADDIDGKAIDITGTASNVVVTNLRCSNCNRSATSESPVNLADTVKNIILSNISIDTTANAATSPPISIAAGVRDVTLSNIQLVGSSKDCTISGLNIKWDNLNCTGRQLGRPRYKFGRFVGNHSFGDGIWVSGILTDSGGSKRIETTDGLFREYAHSTLNGIEGFRVSTYTERDQNPYIRFRYRSEQTTGVRFLMGWTSDDTQLGPTGADPQVSKSCVMLKFDAGIDNQLKIYHNSGDATTTTGANIATIDNAVHTFEIRADNANSKFQYRFDLGAWVDLSTDIPAATTDLGVQFYVENQEDTVSKTMNMLEAYTEVPNI